MKSVILQVFDAAGEHAGVGGGAAFRGARQHQIGFQTDGSARRNGRGNVRFFHQRHGHGVGIIAEDFIDFSHIFTSLLGNTPAVENTAGMLFYRISSTATSLTLVPVAPVKIRPPEVSSA